MHEIRILARIAALVMLLLVASAATVAQLDGAAREQLHRVPVRSADGAVQVITMRLCLPPGSTPLPLAMVNHGMPRDEAERAHYAPYPCDAEAIRWFVSQGFAVAVPIRRGYGPEGGTWAEEFYCRPADFATSAREAARDMDAALGFARGLPEIDAARPAIVVGQSAGGWGALAFASRNPHGVAAIVNFAGGVGGRAGWMPNTNCGVDFLVKEAGEFGTTARVPSLWLYTANDSFFAPEIANAMHRAFTASGGGAELAMLPAWGGDGHRLFFGQSGSDTWGPVVAGFLHRIGFRP
jgi:dienelactone hydrolase